MQILAVFGVSGIIHATQILVGASIVGGILFHELPGKFGMVRTQDLNVRRCATSLGRVLSRCIPEVMGLSTVLFMACLLRLRGDTEVLTDPADIQAWENIKQEWPILMGADTLLNLQAMLRLIVVLFVGFRADRSVAINSSGSKGSSSPLSGTCAALFLASMISRGMLSSRSKAYWLEGPLALGGDLPILCEAAMVPFLVALSIKALKGSPVLIATLVSGAVWFSRCHYLRLDGVPDNDSLFILAHVLEVLASFAFLSRTLTSFCSAEKSSGFIGFIQILMPIQQAFSAYYFMTAFEGHPPMAGRGRPMCVLIIGNLMQLVAYLCAAGLYLGEYSLANDAVAANATDLVAPHALLGVDANDTQISQTTAPALFVHI